MAKLMEKAAKILEILENSSMWRLPKIASLLLPLILLGSAIGPVLGVDPELRSKTRQIGSEISKVVKRGDGCGGNSICLPTFLKFSPSALRAEVLRLVNRRVLPGHSLQSANLMYRSASETDTRDTVRNFIQIT